MFWLFYTSLDFNNIPKFIVIIGSEYFQIVCSSIWVFTPLLAFDQYSTLVSNLLITQRYIKKANEIITYVWSGYNR